VATTIFGQGVPFSILGAKVLRYFRSREYRGDVPGDESSMERKFQGAKVPPMELSLPVELSLPGGKVRGNESSSYVTYYPVEQLPVADANRLSQT